MAQGRGETVLIVEDEISTREALADIAEILNYEVLTAGNGVEALEEYDAHDGEIDLVISDMIMPKMNGSELFNELKARDASVKMILITGYPLDSSGKEILDQGIVNYIQKPVQIQDVAAAMRNAIDDRP